MKPPPAETSAGAPYQAIALCDGASRGNPGPAGVGVVVKDASGRLMLRVSEAIGPATNNQAEYRALIAALEGALRLGVTRLRVQMDSLLVVSQMRGDYRVRNPGLRLLWQRAASLAERFERVEFAAVPREQNRQADVLASRGAAQPYRPAAAVADRQAALPPD